MSKTSQENKAKKAQIAQEVQDKKTERKADAVETKVDTDQATSDVKNEATPEVDQSESDTVEESAETETKARKAKVRGKKYQAVKKLVDIDKYYPLKKAIDLVKKVSLSKFNGKVEAHLTVLDIGNLGEISFPHLETASKKIVILNDAILKDIKAGKIDFDILIATPATMPKLLPFAKTLGPKGLMPNPKNGTLTDDPESAQKKLSVAKTQIKTEKKAPVVHLVVGQVSQPTSELEANIKEMISVIGLNKIKKLALCPTMGPSVKVEIVKEK